MAIVLDASTLLAVAFNELTPERKAVLFDRIARETAVVPAIFVAEIANGLEIGRRRGRISEAKMTAFTSDVSLLPISSAQTSSVHDIAPLQALAERHGLSAYDASYLGLAAAEASELITLDAALERAAQQAGVKVSQP